MSEFTCKDCSRFNNVGYCEWHSYCPDATDEACPDFRTKDGKRPRFCRLASSVDEMAEAFVESGYNKDGEDGWYFVREPSRLYFDRDIPKAKAKAWLMEVEND